MFAHKNNSVFSKILLFITGIIYALNYVMEDAIYRFTYLDPELIINNLEFWRLFTYPLAPGSIEGVILFVITFYFISPRLEKLFQKVLYPFLLGLLVLLQGLILTVLFWENSYTISGFEGLSIYILTLYSLLKPNTRIAAFNFPAVAANTFGFSTILLWSAMKTLDIFTNYQVAAMPTIVVAGFGFLAGLLTYLRILQIDKKQRKEFDEKYSDVDLPEPEELSMALISDQKIKKYKNKQIDEELNDIPIFLSDDPDINERQLNEILDKINSYGKDSLTNSEKTFLKQYSKTI